MVELLSNILFIDDDQAFLDSMRRIVNSEKYPWRMYSVTSPKEALEMKNIELMDVILTDLLMPGHDGFWLLEQVNNSETLKHIPVIVLSGSGEEHLKHKALLMGATDLLNKPIHPDDLFVRITSTLKMKEYQDELIRRNKILEKEVLRRTNMLEASQMEIIWKLARAGEFRDEQSGRHVARVGCYSQTLARCLHLPPDEVATIFLAAPLHDIGKIGVPEAILRKPLPLTDADIREIRNHCIYGQQILLDRSEKETQFLNHFLENKRDYLQTSSLANPFLEKAAEIAVSHHENWDGSGYPYGLKGESIPLSGRIVAIADSYDAMRLTRVYKPAYTAEETVRLINNESGYRFDPDLVAVFNQITKEFDIIWEGFYT